MNKMKFLLILCFITSIIKPQIKPYLSEEYGFSINFPNEIEMEELDKFSHSFTSYEIVDSSFILYQVQIIEERPGAPLNFSTKEEYKYFLLNFLENSKAFYTDTTDLKKSIFLYEDKYYALDYEFKGLWTILNTPVFNKGLVILQDHTITRISFISSQELQNNTILNNKFHDYIYSFQFLEK